MPQGLTPWRPPRQLGLTLVELLVTLTVLAVVLGVVFPGFRDLTARNALTTSANDLVLAVSYARSEAARLGGGVRLCAADPAATDDEWGGGWRVVEGSCDTGTVLRTFPAVSDALTVDAVADTISVEFDGRGGIVGAAPTIQVCHPGDRGVEVRLSAIGRAATSDLTAEQCA